MPDFDDDNMCPPTSLHALCVDIHIAAGRVGPFAGDNRGPDPLASAVASRAQVLVNLDNPLAPPTFTVSKSCTVVFHACVPNVPAPPYNYTSVARNADGTYTLSYHFVDGFSAVGGVALALPPPFGAGVSIVYPPIAGRVNFSIGPDGHAVVISTDRIPFPSLTVYDKPAGKASYTQDWHEGDGSVFDLMRQSWHQAFNCQQ